MEATNNPINIPKNATILGYTGLIPFVILSLALWFSSPGMVEQINQALLMYSAIILTFMGAVHWGVAMSTSEKPDNWQINVSVVPALIAWFASFAPVSINYTILYLTFASLCLIDSVSSKKGSVPDWYPKLRIPLTAVVVACLINAQVASVMVY